MLEVWQELEAARDTLAELQSLQLELTELSQSNSVGRMSAGPGSKLPVARNTLRETKSLLPAQKETKKKEMKKIKKEKEYKTSATQCSLLSERGAHKKVKKSVKKYVSP